MHNYENEKLKSESEVIGEVVHARDYDGWVIVQLSDSRTVTGTFDLANGEIITGITYRFFGTWKNHDRYGMQFRCESHVVAETQNRTGVVAYLTRYNLFTKSQANKLFDSFGINTIKTCRENPNEVAQLTGDEKRAREASAKLYKLSADEPARIGLFNLFAGRGVPKGAIEACINRWGHEAPSVVARNPYKMLVEDIPGIGFRRADKLYIDLGKPPGSIKRQMLAAWNALRESNTGNTWDEQRIAEKGIATAVGFSNPDIDFERAIELGVRAKWLVRRCDQDGNEWLSEYSKANAEQRLAYHIKRILSYRSILPTYGYTMYGLSEHQVGIVGELIRNSLMILAGSPGTGKTYSGAVILKRAIQQFGEKGIVVCAPTGKAAVRITEAMQQYKLPFQATTIHTALGVLGCDHGDWRFRRCETLPLEQQLIVIDELSMCDTPLMAAVLAAVPKGGNVLMIGDPNQLPPVGHGAPLRDMIEARVPTGMLTEIRRNSGAIVEGCARIKDGEKPVVYTKGNLEEGKNLVHVDCGMDTKERVAWVARVLSKIHSDGIYDRVWDVQVLTATNKARKQFNEMMQDGLNPMAIGEKQINPAFRVGDKVICLKNTKAKCVQFTGSDARLARNPDNWKSLPDQAYVANGDLGRVIAVRSTGAIVQFFNPPRIVSIVTEKPKRNADGEWEQGAGDFDLAYAITVHKSQGSSAPVIIVNLEDSFVTSREHLYTAISRAEKVCVLLGSMQTAMKQINRVSLHQRKTFLVENLANAKQEHGSELIEMVGGAH